MHLLFETAAGFALFQVKGGEKFVEEAKDLGAEFASLEAAKKVVKLKDFRPFENITQALECAAATMDNKLSKDLKKALKKAEGSTLAVADAKLGSIIKDKLGIACVHGSGTMELMRGVRSQAGEHHQGQAGHRVRARFGDDGADARRAQPAGGPLGEGGRRPGAHVPGTEPQPQPVQAQVQ